jgi:hypothetical protein
MRQVLLGTHDQNRSVALLGRSTRLACLIYESVAEDRRNASATQDRERFAGGRRPSPTVHAGIESCRSLQFMKHPLTSRLSNEQIGPLARFVRSQKGGLTEITRRLYSATGKRWNRASIEDWLHPKPNRRTQPLFGSGLLLVKICREYQEERNGKQ